MGRFFQTDKPQFVDNKILQLPYQLMGQVIQSIDSDVAQKEANIHSLYDKLQANSLSQDKPRLQEIFSGYEKEIDNLAKSIQENPLEFRKKSGVIRDLSRRLHEDFTRGEVFSIQSNFDAFQSFRQRGQEAVKKGDVLQDDFNFAQNKFINEFQGTNFNQGSFDSIKLEDLNKFIDVENLAETRGKDYVASVAQQIGGFSDGRFIYEDESKTKLVPYNKIYSGVYSALANDKELNSYLQQQVRLGKITPEQYKNTLLAATERVSNKFSFKETKTSRKIKNDQEYLENLKQRNRKDLAKFKKKLEDEEVLNNFSPTFSRSSAMLDKDKFNFENVNSYSDFLNEDINSLKQVDTSGFNDVELREHNYNIDSKQAALNRLNSIKEKSIDAAYRQMRDEGKITEQDYQNFVDYQSDKVNIDNTVIPIINQINEDIDNLNLTSPLGPDTGVFNDVNQQTSRAFALKKATLQSKLDSDPEFAKAYNKYNAGRAMYKDLNKGESIQLIDGLAITLEKPNQYINKWYKENSDNNVVYNSAISVNPKDKDFVSVIDNMATLNSGEVKVLSTTNNTFNRDGTIKPKELKPSINEDTFFEVDDESNFSLNNLLLKTGRKPSELFNIKGLEPSKNGTRVIYEYDENKLKDTGIDAISGLSNGQQFILEFPNSGMESLVRDKYLQDKNSKAVEIAKAFTSPVYMHISNEVDNVIKDITSDNFEQGPQNTIFVDGLRLNLTASKNPNGGFIYNISGKDVKNGREFNTKGIPSSDNLKFFIKNYLDVRNSGKL